MRKSTLLRATILSALVLASGVSFALAAGDSPSAIGHWEGHIEVPGTELGVVVDLLHEEGTWKGHLDIPAQSIQDFALKNIEVDGASVQFELTVVPGEPTFTGSLSEDGTTLSGNFVQGGQTLPFTLTRSSAEPEPVKEMDAGLREWLGEGTPGLGVAGGWRGAIVLGQTLRIEVKISQGEAGTYTGTMDSIDQGANGLALDAITVNPDGVSFSVPSVNGHFEGKFENGGATLVGTWSQGPGGLPLTFFRQGPS